MNLILVQQEISKETCDHILVSSALVAVHSNLSESDIFPFYTESIRHITVDLYIVQANVSALIDMKIIGREKFIADTVFNRFSRFRAIEDTQGNE